MGQVIRHVTALTILTSTACAVGSAAPSPDLAARVVGFPSIVMGSATSNDEIQAAQLLAESRDAFEALNYQVAGFAAGRVVDEFPTAPGSAEALWIVGRSALEVGDPQESIEATDLLLEILPQDHPVVNDATIVRGDALLRDRQFAAATASYLSLPAGPGADSLAGRVSEAVVELDRSELESLLPEARARDLRAAPLMVELALVHALVGDSDLAKELANDAVALGLSGRPELAAEAVLSGDLSGFVAAELTIGAVLPITGSPTNREYADRFLEGVRVGLDLAAENGMAAQLIVKDNGGTSIGTTEGLSALEDQGALAVLGPLLDANVQVAAESRVGSLALLSPTGRAVSGKRAVYSMVSVDPGAARLLAETVAEAGFRDVVIVHSMDADQTQEAMAFAERFVEAGGQVRDRIEYAPGTTYFAEPMKRIEALLPSLVLFAIPTSDIEILAPQFSFFGLDTLDIEIAGTAPWTDPRVLASVANRHTDRVISVALAPPGTSPNLGDAFVDAYETRYRKTLRSAVPALGFDMTRMILEAYGAGVRTSGDLARALETMERFQGVTGTYSVADGKVVRDFFAVKIFDRGLVPADSVIPRPVRPTVPPRS